MCTNSARLVRNLECYMDDLVDSFEDFVKKSLVIISVAVGALIVMLGYALKLVTERAPPPISEGTAVPDGGIGGPGSLPRGQKALKRRSNFTKSFDDIQTSMSSTLPQTSVVCCRKECKKTTSAEANTGPLSNIPSFDERVLRNIGLSSCSKSCMQSKRSLMNTTSSCTRVTIPSMPTCIPNHHLSTPRQCSKFVANRNSCCSMCCADDDRR